MFADAVSSASRYYRPNGSFGLVVRLEHEPLNLLGSPSWRLLVELAARRWNVEGGLILSHSRDQLVAVARHHAMWLIRTHTRMSLTRIGRLFGRHHTTVLSSVRRHEARIAGQAPMPFVWTVRAVRQLTWLLQTHTISEACRKMGLAPADYLRCPGRMRVVSEARRQAGYRNWQVRQARRQAA